MSTPEHEALDEAIRTYVASRDAGGKYFATGWVLSVAAVHTEDPEISCYLSPYSARMPYHARYGLLQVTIDGMIDGAYRLGGDGE